MTTKAAEGPTKEDLYFELEEKGVSVYALKQVIRGQRDEMRQAVRIIKHNVVKLKKAEAGLKKAKRGLLAYSLDDVPGGKVDARQLGSTLPGRVWLTQSTELTDLAMMISDVETETAAGITHYEKQLGKTPSSVASQAKMEEKDVAAYWIWRTLKENNVLPGGFKGALLWHFLGYEPEYPVKEVRNLSPQINRFYTSKDTAKKAFDRIGWGR
jgi:hypothetical protein